jgi:hypothetical protein
MQPRLRIAAGAYFFANRAVSAVFTAIKKFLCLGQLAPP